MRPGDPVNDQSVVPHPGCTLEPSGELTNQCPDSTQTKNRLFQCAAKSETLAEEPTLQSPAYTWPPSWKFLSQSPLSPEPHHHYQFCFISHLHVKSRKRIKGSKNRTNVHLLTNFRIRGKWGGKPFWEYSSWALGHTSLSRTSRLVWFSERQAVQGELISIIRNISTLVMLQ